MAFSYTIKEERGVCEIRLDGNLLTAYDARELTEALKETLLHTNKFIINLKSLKYMNSEGFNILLQILTRSRNAGGDSIIINLSAELKELFIITKLHHIFTTASTKKEAINLLKG